MTYRSGTGAEVSTSLDRVVVDEVVAGLPVREFRWYKGRRHYSGWYWSATMRQMVVYESRLELARIMLADFDPSVVAISAQPFRLSGRDGDRVRRHVPDLLLVDRFGGVTVVDVKAPHKREDAQVRAVMAWTRAVVALRGWDFEEWYGAPRQVLSNVTFLAGYRRETRGGPVPRRRCADRGRRRCGDRRRGADARYAWRGAGAAGGAASVVAWGIHSGSDQAAGRVDCGQARCCGGDDVTGQSVLLQVGARFAFDGELVEVVQFDGARTCVRDGQDRWRTVSSTGFLVRASAAGAPPATEALGTRLAAVPSAQRAAVAERAGHVREVLTGYRSGSAEAALVGEPHVEYESGGPVRARQAAKAAELGVSERTVRRWVRAYTDSGEAGLLDERHVTGRASTVDPRWVAACREVLAQRVADSTPTASAVLRRVRERLDACHGPGVVTCPSMATAYRHLAYLAKGTNALHGSAKARRSIADRPKGVYGRLRATRPGEYVILDTQSLDVFAMEPVTCRGVPAQLTVAQDLFTRCIIGMRVTAVSTKAVDVAGVLHQSVVAQPTPETWPDEARWPYHGLPQHVVFTEAQPAPAGPVYAPETLVVDHGKAFLSAHVISVCTRLGISIQPAQPRKPTDKPTVERFFKTLREGLIQYLPAYKGPDVYSRGKDVESAAFLYLHELEDVIREWVALVYHRSKHDGLAVPEWPHLDLSPNDMFEIGVARAGLLRIPANPELAYDFMDTVARTIQHYGWRSTGCVTTVLAWTPTATPEARTVVRWRESGRCGSTRTTSAMSGSRTRMNTSGTGWTGNTPPRSAPRSASKRPATPAGSRCATTGSATRRRR